LWAWVAVSTRRRQCRVDEQVDAVALTPLHRCRIDRAFSDVDEGVDPGDALPVTEQPVPRLGQRGVEERSVVTVQLAVQPPRPILLLEQRQALAQTGPRRRCRVSSGLGVGGGFGIVDVVRFGIGGWPSTSVRRVGSGSGVTPIGCSGLGRELFGSFDAASGAKSTKKTERLRGLELFGRVGACWWRRTCHRHDGRTRGST
jgi:hypothetical protein